MEFSFLVDRHCRYLKYTLSIFHITKTFYLTYFAHQDIKITIVRKDFHDTYSGEYNLETKTVHLSNTETLAIRPSARYPQRINYVLNASITCK